MHKCELTLSDKGCWINQTAAVADDAQPSTSTGISNETGGSILKIPSRPVDASVKSELVLYHIPILL